MPIDSIRAVATPHAAGRYDARVWGGTKIVTTGPNTSSGGHPQISWDVLDTVSEATTSNAIRIPRVNQSLITSSRVGDRHVIVFSDATNGQACGWNPTTGALDTVTIPAGNYFASVGCSNSKVIAPQSAKTGTSQTVVIIDGTTVSTASYTSPISAPQYYDGVEMAGEAWFPERSLGHWLAVDITTGACRTVTITGKPSAATGYTCQLIAGEIWTVTSGYLYMFNGTTHRYKTGGVSGAYYSSVTNGTTLWVPDSAAAKLLKIDIATETVTKTIVTPSTATYTAQILNGHIVTPTYRVSLTTDTATSLGMSAITCWTSEIRNNQVWFWYNATTSIKARTVDSTWAESSAYIPAADTLMSGVWNTYGMAVDGDDLWLYPRNEPLIERIDLTTGALTLIPRPGQAIMVTYRPQIIGTTLVSVSVGDSASPSAGTCEACAIDLTTGEISAYATGVPYNIWIGSDTDGTHLYTIAGKDVLKVAPNLSYTKTTYASLTAAAKWGCEVEGGELFTADDTGQYIQKIDLTSGVVSSLNTGVSARRLAAAMYGTEIVFPRFGDDDVDATVTSLAPIATTAASFLHDPVVGVQIGDTLWFPSSASYARFMAIKMITARRFRNLGLTRGARSVT